MAADRDRGFTLVEVVIAIVLVGILSSVVVVGVGQLTNRGTVASCAASQDAARAAATVHFGSAGSYPTSFTELTAGSSPPLTLPSGATVNATGDMLTAGGWTLWLLAGSGSTPPSFTCLDGIPWAPAQLGSLALWLDASDTSTLTASGTAVSEWRDRSGNNRHAVQATAAAQPQRVDAALGGRPALVFDGTNDVLNIAAYSVPQPYEMWAAFSLPVDPVGEADLWGSVNPVVVTRPRWGVGGTTRLVYAGGDFTSPRLTVGSHVWGVGMNGASSFDRLNGTPAATGNAGTWSLGGGTRIGQGQNTSVFLRANVGELVVVPRSLSVADRERLEGYLAHKWGMAASLPANHPFRNAPPTV